MRAVLLDTTAYTAFMLGAAEVVEVVAHAEKLFLTSIVLGELLGGFAAGTREPPSNSPSTMLVRNSFSAWATTSTTSAAPSMNAV